MQLPGYTYALPWYYTHSRRDNLLKIQYLLVLYKHSYKRIINSIPFKPSEGFKFATTSFISIEKKINSYNNTQYDYYNTERVFSIALNY